MTKETVSSFSPCSVYFSFISGFLPLEEAFKQIRSYNLVYELHLSDDQVRDMIPCLLEPRGTTASLEAGWTLKLPSIPIDALALQHLLISSSRIKLTFPLLSTPHLSFHPTSFISSRFRSKEQLPSVPTDSTSMSILFCASLPWTLPLFDP